MVDIVGRADTLGKIVHVIDRSEYIYYRDRVRNKICFALFDLVLEIVTRKTHVEDLGEYRETNLLVYLAFRNIKINEF